MLRMNRNPQLDVNVLSFNTVHPWGIHYVPEEGMGTDKIRPETLIKAAQNSVQAALLNVCTLELSRRRLKGSDISSTPRVSRKLGTFY
jgi:hypothetical protein